MIREIKINEIEEVNLLLGNFNYKIDEKMLDEPFFRCIGYFINGIKGVLLFSKIYDRIEIEYVIVSQEYFNKHIGSNLMQYLINYSIKHNMKNITLEVNVNNNRAINLYRKFDFEEISRRKNYYGEEDAIVMIRKFDNNE